MLATLELINAQLGPQRKRLMLITGSNYVHAAAKERLLEGRDFRWHYIRHPKAFLGTRGFFRKTGASKTDPDFEVVDWLNLFFPQVIKQYLRPGDTINPDALHKIFATEDSFHKQSLITLRKAEHGAFEDVVGALSKQIRETALDRNVREEEDVEKVRVWLRGLCRSVGSPIHDGCSEAHLL